VHRLSHRLDLEVVEEARMLRLSCLIPFQAVQGVRSMLLSCFLRGWRFASEPTYLSHMSSAEYFKVLSDSRTLWSLSLLYFRFQVVQSEPSDIVSTLEDVKSEKYLSSPHSVLFRKFSLRSA
jgi:hypothetical protein